MWWGCGEGVWCGVVWYGGGVVVKRVNFKLSFQKCLPCLFGSVFPLLALKLVPFLRFSKRKIDFPLIFPFRKCTESCHY